MPFRQNDLHDLEIAREVRIETQAPRGELHSTIVWVVVDAGEVFVRSVRGDAGRWYQEALRNPDVTLDDSGRRLEARAVPADDPATLERVSDAITRKYANDSGYRSMVQPEVVGSTLRLEPYTDQELPLEAPARLGADEPSQLETKVEMAPLDAGPPIEEDVILQPRKPV